MRNYHSKELIVRDIQKNFRSARAVIFYDFHYAENEEIFQLRKELKKTGSYWKVYKNNLVKKALPEFELSLQKANALIFCHDDEYKPLGVLAQFNKKDPHIKRFRGGIYNQSFIADTLLEKWANLPSKEILINTLCYYLSWQVRRLVRVLEKVKAKAE